MVELPTACSICGQFPAGAYYRSLRDTSWCAEHVDVLRCGLCHAAGRRGAPGWYRVQAEILRCPDCAVGAVVTPEDLRRHVPTVRRGLRSLGLELEGRVRIRLVDPTELSLGCRVPSGRVLGVTHLVEDPDSHERAALDIKVLRGLPPLWFATTAAHENMHAWLAEHGIRTPRPEIEEGLCEVVAYGWLALQPDPLAERIRATMKESSDPVYGAGLREVQALVARHGLRKVLQVLRATGDVPT